MFFRSEKCIYLSAPLAVVACTTTDYELPDIQSCEPAELEAGEAGEIVVLGSSFTTRLTNNVESGETFIGDDY